MKELCEHKEGICAESQSARYKETMLYLVRKLLLPGRSVSALN